MEFSKQSSINLFGEYSPSLLISECMCKSNHPILNAFFLNYLDIPKSSNLNHLNNIDECFFLSEFEVYALQE